MAKEIQREKNKAEDVTVSDFKQFQAWLWQKNRQIDNWNRTERPAINSHVYGQLIYSRRAKNINGEMIVSSINGIGETGQPHGKKKKKDKYLTQHTKTNSKWMSLKIRLKTINS